MEQMVDQSNWIQFSKELQKVGTLYFPFMEEETEAQKKVSHLLTIPAGGTARLISSPASRWHVLLWDSLSLYYCYQCLFQFYLLLKNGPNQGKPQKHRDRKLWPQAAPGCIARLVTLERCRRWDWPIHTHPGLSTHQPRPPHQQGLVPFNFAS